MADSEERRDPMEARVITVSREALRADLAQMRGDINAAMADMELRLTRSLAEMLARKADLVMHQELEGRVRTIERDAVFRTGPSWAEIRAWIQDIEDTVVTHDRLVPVFEELQRTVQRNSDKIKSDAELKTMMRDERGQATGAQWNTVSKIIVVITTIVAILGLYLAWQRAAPSATPKESVSIVEHIPRQG